MAQLLSDAQMACFEDQGYCTVDALAPGGLSEAELDAAEETWDRLIAGGVNGPYQTMHVPHGWVTDPEERERVRAPEDACTQYVGDKQPAVLSMIQAPPSHMY